MIRNNSFVVLAIILSVLTISFFYGPIGNIESKKTLENQEYATLNPDAVNDLLTQHFKEVVLPRWEKHQIR